MNFDEMVETQAKLTAAEGDAAPVMTRLTRDVACHILKNADQERQARGKWTGNAQCVLDFEGEEGMTEANVSTYCVLAEIGRVLGVDLTQEGTRSSHQLRLELAVLGLPTDDMIRLNDGGMTYVEVAEWLSKQPVADEVKDQPADAADWPLP